MASEAAELLKLQKTKEAFPNDWTPAEQKRLEELTVQGNKGTPNGAAGDGEELSIPVNVEQFQKGWAAGNNQPPAKAGLYRGVCTGLEASRREDSEGYFIQFKSPDGAWRGSYFADELTAKDGRAGKLKDALEAMAVPYRLDGSRVKFKNPTGKEADCDWQPISSGKRQGQLSINGVYKPGEIKQS